MVSSWYDPEIVTDSPAVFKENDSIVAVDRSLVTPSYCSEIKPGARFRKQVSSKQFPEL